MHCLEQRDVRVVSAPFRQVIEAEVVGRRGFVTPPSLEQAHDVLRSILPPVRAFRIGALRGEVVVVVRQALLFVRWGLQIARQQVEQQAVVGRALDVRLAAQGVDAAAGHADVPQQELQHGIRAYVLRSVSVLGGTHCVEPGTRAAAFPRRGVPLANLPVVLDGRPGDIANRLHVVPCEMLLHELENTTRMLERHVFFRRAP